MCTSGANKPTYVLPLSNDSRCEGVAIGGVFSRGAWRGWSSEAYSNLTTEGVTWSVEDVLITDDMVRAHKLEKAAQKVAKKAREKKTESKKSPAPGAFCSGDREWGRGGRRRRRALPVR